MRTQPAQAPRAVSRRLFVVPAGIFGVAAIAAAITRSQQPYDHGWWLVAYLALVGAISQLALGAGQLTLDADRPPTAPGRRICAAEVVLWNLGAALVPVGVFTGAPAVVDAGSVMLLAALVLFATETKAPRAASVRGQRLWLYAYRATVVLLSASVVVGTALADALPWQ